MDQSSVFELLAGAKSYKRIKGSVFFVEDHKGQQFILKLKSNNRRSLIGKILARQSLSFRTELAVNKQLAKMDFNHLKTPTMSRTDGKTYMLFKYIPNTGENYEKIPTECIAESLFEFSKSGINPYVSFTQKVTAPLFKTLTSLIRAIVTILPSDCGIEFVPKALSVVMRSIFAQPTVPNAMLLHKDLRFRQNYLVSETLGLFFIDFGSAIRERRWIMMDVVDLAFDAKRMYVNFDLIEQYYRILVRENLKVNLKVQVRIALIRKVIFYLRSREYSGDNKALFKIFLFRILLDDQSYDDWFNNRTRCALVKGI